MTIPPLANEEIAHHIYESLLDKGAIYDETSDIIIPKIIEALDAKDREKEETRREQIEKDAQAAEKAIATHYACRSVAHAIRSQLTSDTESSNS